MTQGELIYGLEKLGRPQARDKAFRQLARGLKLEDWTND
jgi:hypothetical protein